MHRILSIAGSIIFQLFFTVALAGGIVGAAACWRERPDTASEDSNPLSAVGLLAISLAVVGLIGIIRFRSSAERRLDIETDIAHLRLQKAASNITWGAVGLVAGIGVTLFQIRFPGSNLNGVVTIPVVLICVGTLQFFFGVWQVMWSRKQRHQNTE